jgi:motility quorum-sensing regulator/GCU-specific mRNA interferase toxin
MRSGTSRLKKLSLCGEGGKGMYTIDSIAYAGEPEKPVKVVSVRPLDGCHRVRHVALSPADFYKSMTTHADYKVWQDVYRPSTSAGDVYLKLTVVDDLLIVSFKEL